MELPTRIGMNLPLVEAVMKELPDAEILMRLPMEQEPWFDTFILKQDAWYYLATLVLDTTKKRYLLVIYNIENVGNIEHIWRLMNQYPEQPPFGLELEPRCDFVLG